MTIFEPKDHILRDAVGLMANAGYDTSVYELRQKYKRFNQ